MKEKFLTSINDCRQIRQTFNAFQIHPVGLRYSASHPSDEGRGALRQEVLVGND